jgi:glycosyltransferase involved in cell wall biosynthesis
MSLKKKLPISLNMVIRNEEAVLARSLDSVKDIVDEMIILHDGPVEDRSKEIAQEYGAIFKVMEPWIGVAEPWRIDALKMSANEWILRLDADEFFLNDQFNLFAEVLNADADIVEVKFGYQPQNENNPVFARDSYIPVLFKKSKIGLIGAVNETFHPLEGAKLVRSSIKLVHDPVKYGGGIETMHKHPEIFREKTQKWIRLQATDIINWDKLPRWNYNQPRYEFKANDMAAKSRWYILLLIIPNLWLQAFLQIFHTRKIFPLRFARNLSEYYWRVFKEIKRLKQSQTRV